MKITHTKTWWATFIALPTYLIPINAVIGMLVLATFAIVTWFSE